MWLKRGQAIFRLTGGLKRFLKSSSMRIVRPLWWFHWDNILNRIYKIGKTKILRILRWMVSGIGKGDNFGYLLHPVQVYPTSVQLGCCPSARGHDKWKWQLLWIMFLNQHFVFGGPLFSLCALSVCLTRKIRHLCPKFMVNLCFYLIICLAVHERAPPVFTLEACFQ